MVSLSVVVLAATAGLVLGKTPEGFTPGSTTDLAVVFASGPAENGVVMTKEATSKEPQIGTAQPLSGTSYALIMIDLDIPTNNPPQTNTLLHWMQTGLTPATTSSALNKTGGGVGLQSIYLLQNTTKTAPAAPYFGPNPPARIPLSHRYTQILVDTSASTPQDLASLTTAAKTRMGFDAAKVLQAANLATKVVAGNFFVVTNPGPAANATTTGTGPAGTGTGGGSGGSSGNGGGNGGGSKSGNGGTTTSSSTGAATSTSPPFSAAGGLHVPSSLLAGLILTAGLFWGL